MFTRIRLGALIALIAAVAMAFGACGGDDDADSGDDAGSEAPAEFRVMFPVDHFGSVWPFVLPDELGYFEEENVDVSFEVADGSDGAVQQVIGGNADVAVAAASAYLSAAASGQPVQAVFTTQYRNIFTLVAPSDSGIESVDDLQGATVGVSDPAGGEVALIRGVFREAGLGENDYQIAAVGEGAALTVESLRGGDIAAYSSNLWDADAIEVAGVDIERILPEEAENFPGNQIVVSTSTIEDRRDELVRFLRAVAKGMAFAEENPDEGFDIISATAPEEFENEELARTQWETALEFLGQPPEGADVESIGAPYMAGLQDLHDFLLEGDEEEGALPEPVDLEATYDMTLLEEANDFERPVEETG